MRSFKLLHFFCLVFMLFCFPIWAYSFPVTLMYHEFDKNNQAWSDISKEDFKNHLLFLKNNGYQVLTLDEFLAISKGEKQAPDLSVLITMDDGDRSVYDIAWPLMKEMNFPLTIFISPHVIDKKTRKTMTWKMLRRLKKEGVSIGAHGYTHRSLKGFSHQFLVNELKSIQERFENELGIKPQAFAYPYGNINPLLRDIFPKYGYQVAFSQYSGAMGAKTDRYDLPRFLVSGDYAHQKRLKVASGAKSLPIKDVLPDRVFVRHNPPAIGFTLTQPIKNVRCYANQGELKMIKLGQFRHELRFDAPLKKSRLSISCTAMAKDRRWYWFGKRYFIPLKP